VNCRRILSLSKQRKGAFLTRGETKDVLRSTAGETNPQMRSD